MVALTTPEGAINKVMEKHLRQQSPIRKIIESGAHKQPVFLAMLRSYTMKVSPPLLMNWTGVLV